MIAWAHLDPLNLIGQSASDLARCREPWQILRRDTHRYTVELTGRAAVPLVTIVGDLVVRVDDAQPWPPCEAGGS